MAKQNDTLEEILDLIDDISKKLASGTSNIKNCANESISSELFLKYSVIDLATISPIPSILVQYL